MANINDYPSREVQRTLSLLLELLDHLKAYKEHIILVGGWAPYFIVRRFSDSPEAHQGSLDADLVLDFARISETAYETIYRVLGRIGYQQRKDAKGQIIPASFEKIVPVDDERSYRMQVDFLAPEYGGTGRARRHQKVQDLLAHKARGADLVFVNYFVEDVIGYLPNAARVTVPIKIANEVATITMKGITIGQRTKPKDFYDVYMVLKYFKEGPLSVAQSFGPVARNKLVQEALNNIKRYFSSPDDLGPTSVADFLIVTVEPERSVTKREAYELVQRFLNSLLAS